MWGGHSLRLRSGQAMSAAVAVEVVLISFDVDFALDFDQDFDLDFAFEMFWSQ